MIRASGFAIVAILALSACAPQGTPAPAASPPVTVTVTATTTVTVSASPAAPQTAANLALGQPIEAAGNARMTVSAFKAYPKGYHDVPLVGALAQGCNLGSVPVSFSTSPWTVAAADGSTFKVMGTFYGNDPTPQYPIQQIVAAGQCVKGWLLFEIPAGTTIDTIRYAVELDTGLLMGTWKAA